ncbi:MAG: dipicolinate synthase subunit DpsA [Acetivibrionales bacterium]|nr:dipicolinate synthase subunit DpsA [Bacillota bacterium]NLP06718.1 dipicolinate synthase subunit DpsA [Clostridiaceae bacterium]HOA55974.1 dipicolinate synthase subunit DpsA [Clostridiales bacterium]HPZ05715.1 dipicolinate synthase subunit DpsA [Clostridiales bacterium]HQD31493.1 dipicolinate synthase subunit DpsA [Clostridiales bacterium]
MELREYTVIGGDLRNVKLAEAIHSDGHCVNLFGFKNAGFSSELQETDDLETAIASSDIIIGPLPCTSDNEMLNAPFHDKKIHISEVFKIMKKAQLFIAGRINGKIMQMAQAYNIRPIDILEREEMAVLNAIPTAEGAIQIAMEELPVTLNGSRVLILGYGRLGKVLAKMLSGLGAEVYVATRKYSDAAWLRAYGINSVYMDGLDRYLADMDLIINTIPDKVLDQAKLELIEKESLVIDLASKPGGVDFEKAGQIGIKVIWALSLPGKVAPVTAANYMKQTIYNILQELGV